MTDWAGWDKQLLAYQGDPITAENIATVDAFQHIEGHGGDYNPFNVGPGPFHGVNLENAPFGGRPSPFPPTLDFPSPQSGVAASEVVGESNWEGLLRALKTGHPLSDNTWIIDQGAATPAPEYTAEVRQLAYAYLTGTSRYDLGDTSLNRNEPGSGPNIPPSGVPGGGPSAPSDQCYPACGGNSFPCYVQKSPDTCNVLIKEFGPKAGQNEVSYPGTLENGQCCIKAGTGAQTTPYTGPTSGGNCGCISIPLAGDLCLVPSSICDFFDAIASEAFWLRVGEIVLGALLLWIGASRLVKGIPGPGAAAKGATLAAL